MNENPPNIDERVVAGFGSEWSRFDQQQLDTKEKEETFNNYFSIFPWNSLPASAIGVDVGCGSGRWALLVAPRVGRLYCVDASDEAVSVARRAARDQPNIVTSQATLDSLPFNDESLDFAYSLGVLHHIPDPAAGVRAIARVLKHGAPFLLYVYYDFDGKPYWYAIIWKATNMVRQLVARLPRIPKNATCDLIALLVYWPLARFGGLMKKVGVTVSAWPLAFYRDKSFYTMRTDSLDRFGTLIEHRFNRGEVEALLLNEGFVDVRFSDCAPFWCAVGVKK